MTDASVPVCASVLRTEYVGSVRNQTSSVEENIVVE